MLNLTVETRKVTQGQPAADRTVAVQRQDTPPAPAARSEGPSSSQALEPDPVITAPGNTAIDVQEVAHRVYELMRQELLIERDRRGRRPL
jgi:hypothetical protein